MSFKHSRRLQIKNKSYKDKEICMQSYRVFAQTLGFLQGFHENAMLFTWLKKKPTVLTVFAKTQGFFCKPHPSSGGGRDGVNLEKYFLLGIERYAQISKEKSCLPTPALLGVGFCSPDLHWPFLFGRVGKHDFSVQLWTFYSISSKRIFLVNGFPYSPASSWGVKGLGAWVFYADVDISFNCWEKIGNWSPFHQGWGLANMIFLCRSA